MARPFSPKCARELDVSSAQHILSGRATREQVREALFTLEKAGYATSELKEFDDRYDFHDTHISRGGRVYHHHHVGGNVYKARVWTIIK